ncbi:hypothetical protein [Flagellimonas flava]|uniref:DUF1579 domain-containing protein n=1 Tax=Flagellimonas flava TaxID=570519 RepID=A0A1M5Q3Z2_9FLAO|nr:hypothetical protein [Allomuricauda flava]SHH08977.1 hypothetical protein SAMN04488116_3498 [Allomuricauda flava]
MKILWVISAVLILSTSCTTQGKEKTAETAGLNHMTKDYGSLGKDAPKETEQWGQLAGEWECISKDLDRRDKENPQWYSNRATWQWEYVLGGHAVLNRYWQEDNSPNPVTKDFFATGIFIFNPKTSLWEAVVLNTRAHRISSKFQASFKDGKIEMHDGSGTWLVTFFNIKKNSFDWKYEVLKEDGGWKSISEISAKRKHKIGEFNI